MSSAIHNLQTAIVEGKQSLSQLLMQTKLIAAKLNLKDVEKWVNLELNGYPDGKDFPDYRYATTEKLISHNPYRGWEYVGDVQQAVPVYHPISEIERLAMDDEVSFAPRTNITMNRGTQWPQRLTLSAGQFKKILESVRYDLLQWAIELEKRGIKGENMNFNEKEKQSATSQIFNIQKFTGVLGNVNDSQVSVYDFSSIEQILKDYEVPKLERRALEDILDELKAATAEQKPSLIQRGELWLNKHKELLGTAAETVGRVIKAATEQR